MRAGMPRPAAGKPHTVDEHLRDLDTAAALRAAVREAAELLVAETTPLPPQAEDYLPPTGNATQIRRTTTVPNPGCTRTIGRTCRILEPCGMQRHRHMPRTAG